MGLKKANLLALAMVIMVLVGGIPLTLLNTVEVGAEPQTRATHDLSIDKIDVLANLAGEKKYFPGMTVTLYVDVLNEGSMVPPSMSFEVVLVVDDKLDNVTTMTALVYGLGAGMNKTVVFQYTIDPHPTYDLPHSFNVVATVNYQLDQDNSNNQLVYPNAFTVYSPTLFKPRIEIPPEYKNVQVTLLGGSMSTPVQLKIILKNEANVADFIGMEVVEAPEMWVVPELEPRLIDGKQNVTLENYVITLPSNKLYAQNEVDYVVKLRPYSLFYPQGDYPVEEVHFSIDFIPGASIVPVEPEKYVTPGRRETVRFNITNLGNGPDVFDFALGDLDPIAKKQGWQITLHTRTLYNPLAPGESAEIIVMVVCPTTVPKNLKIELRIKAISQKDPEYVKLSAPMRLYADTYIAAAFEEEEYTWRVNPGEVNRFTINVTNLGNGRDSTLRVHPDGVPPGWAVSIDQSVLYQGVGPRTTVSLPVSIYVPPTSRSGHVLFEFVITGGNGYTLATADVIVEIKEAYGVELTADAYMKKGFVGSETFFTLVVRNMGNTEDTFLLSVDSPWAELEFDRVEDLSNNFTFDLTLKVKVPPGTPADSDPTSPTVIDPYPIRVTVISQNDTRVSQTLVLYVEVQPFYNFRFFLKERRPILINSNDPDTFLLYNVYVENLGNFRESIRFDLEDPPSWVKLKTLYSSVAYGQTGKAILQIAPPPGIEPGYHNITLIGTAKEDPNIVRRITIPILFYSLDFSVVSVKINGEYYTPGEVPEVEVNKNYSIVVNITNQGSMDYAFTLMPSLYVGLYLSGNVIIAKKNVTYVPRGGYAEISFKWMPTVFGENMLTIKVDDRNRIPEGNERNNTITLTLNAPRPKGEEIQKTKSYGSYYLLLIFLLFGLLMGSVYFYRKASSIIISPYELGYDETGAYNPAAAKAAFEAERGDVTKKAAEGIGPRSPLAAEEPKPQLKTGTLERALPKAAPAARPTAAPAPRPVTTTRVASPTPSAVSARPAPAQARPAVAQQPQPTAQPLQARPAPQK
ncbi:MAG: hypothetical protein J7L88_05800, partial [Thermoplasmata archaeon]|nr:hypothetical protein [Thermoplasmata archaeon]